MEERAKFYDFVQACGREAGMREREITCVWGVLTDNGVYTLRRFDSMELGKMLTWPRIGPKRRKLIEYMAGKRLHRHISLKTKEEYHA